MSDEDNSSDGNIKPIFAVTQGDNDVDVNTNDDDDDDNEVPPNPTNFLKVKEEKIDDHPVEVKNQEQKSTASDNLVDTSDDESVIKIDPTTVIDNDKSQKVSFPHNFPFPLPKEASSINDLYCDADNIHLQVLEKHLIPFNHGCDQPWRIKAYDTFCKHCKLHMHELHEWEKSMVEDAINKAGAPPLSRTVRIRDQLTIMHVSRFLCLFYGAYRSMLRKKQSDTKNKIVFCLYHAERPFYNQIYQVCDKISITHNKKLIMIMSLGWKSLNQFLKRSFEPNSSSSQNW